MTEPPVVVRVAHLEIDPAQLEAFIAAVREEIEEAVRVEPGVLAIYAVAERDHPARLQFFEIYADDAAYAAHRESPHFRTYLATTNSMIRRRELFEMVPIQLSSKA
ncbi:MAG TPA: antibiotic biosynthesis monooxygenase [Candidatus Limnocylindrales bacterium]